MQVCLVYMPYDFLSLPPLGLSLLTAGAREAGLQVTARYPGFDFAERIGIWEYLIISRYWEGSPLAEWTFAGAAFPEFAPDHEAFLAWRYATDGRALEGVFKSEAHFKQVCLQIRQTATAFVQELAEEIAAQSPAILAVSSTYSQNCASLGLLRQVKALRPETVTILGGANCEQTMGQVLKQAMPCLDYVVSGEADHAFVELCLEITGQRRNQGVAARKPLPPWVFGPGWSPAAAALAPVDGTRGADRGGESGCSSAQPLFLAGVEQDLDSVPIPDYSDFLQAFEHFKYKEKLSFPLLMMETTRGCWWGKRHGCTFCGCNGSRATYRKKSSERVLEEMRTLQRRHGVPAIAMTDTILDMSYFTSVLPKLAEQEEEQLYLMWATTARLTEKQVRMLADANVCWIGPGIEQLQDDLLHLLGKGSDTIHNVALLKYAFEQGVNVDWNMLVDMPGEEDQWYGQAAAYIPLLTHLQPPKRIGHIRFMRFSKYHAQQAEYGLSLLPHPGYAYVYPFDDAQLQDFALTFEEPASHPWKEAPGPGKADALAALQQWMDLHDFAIDTARRPRLTMRDDGDAHVITDTRPVATAGSHRLTGVLKDVHAFFANPQSIQSAVEAVSDRHGRAECDAAVKELQSRGLLLVYEDMALSLALREPMRPFMLDQDADFNIMVRQLIASGRPLFPESSVPRTDAAEARVPEHGQAPAS